MHTPTHSQTRTGTSILRHLFTHSDTDSRDHVQGTHTCTDTHVRPPGLSPPSLLAVASAATAAPCRPLPPTCGPACRRCCFLHAPVCRRYLWGWCYGQFNPLHALSSTHEGTGSSCGCSISYPASGRRQWQMVLGLNPCRACGRPRRTSRLLILSWPSLGCCDHLGE